MTFVIILLISSLKPIIRTIRIPQFRNMIIGYEMATNAHEEEHQRRCTHFS
jgi:hypothetical protein